MSRFFKLFMILLLAVSGGIAFRHWEEFSSGKPKIAEPQMNRLSVEVIVEPDGNKLDVIQKITGFDHEKTYEAVYPKGISDVFCGSRNTCSESAGGTITLPENGEITFTYSIKAATENGFLLLDDWLIGIRGVDTWKMKMMITDEKREGGTWAAGLPLKGHEKLDYVDYYVFEGDGSRPALYWENSKLEEIHSEGLLSFFAAGELSLKSVYFSSLDKLSHTIPFSVVCTSRDHELAGEGLLISSCTKSISKNLETKIAWEMLSLKYGTSADKQVMLEVLASLLTGKQAKSQKAQSMVRELKAGLSKDQIQAFLTGFLDDSSRISYKSMDHFLGAAAGMETDFFSENNKRQRGLIPVLFYKTKSLLLNDRKAGKARVYIHEGKRLYQLPDLLGALGYKVKTKKPDIFLFNKRNESYEFQAESKIYHYNNEEYGVFNFPIVIINGEAYMEENIFQSIFGFRINETESELFLRR